MADNNKERKEIPQLKLPGRPFSKGKGVLGLKKPASAQPAFRERLRNMKRQDLVGLVTGLSVLLMTPLATHFMTQPKQDPFLLDKGTTLRDSVRDGAALFEGEHGETAPGGPIGGTIGSLITPLKAHDPASLVLGFNKKKKARPAVRKASAGVKLRDAMSSATRAAGKRAVRAAGAPKPAAASKVSIPKIAGKLRGLGAASGSSKASGSLGAGSILATAKGAPSKAAARAFANPRASRGFQGTATPNRIDGNAAALRSGAQAAANNFNREGAVNSLAEAARASVGAAGSGSNGGAPFPGKHTNRPGGKYGSRWTVGESLEFFAAKTRLQKELEIEFANRKFWEVDVQQLIAKAFIENIVGEGIAKPLGTAVGRAIGGAPPAPTVYYCYRDGVYTGMSTTDSDERDSWVDGVGSDPCDYVRTEDPEGEEEGGSTTVGGDAPEGPEFVVTYHNFGAAVNGSEGTLGSVSALQAELAGLIGDGADLAAAHNTTASKHEAMRAYLQYHLVQSGQFLTYASQARAAYNTDSDQFMSHRGALTHLETHEMHHAKRHVYMALREADRTPPVADGRTALLAWATLVTAGGEAGETSAIGVPQLVTSVNASVGNSVGLGHQVQGGLVNQGHVGSARRIIAAVPQQIPMFLDRVDASAMAVRRQFQGPIRDRMHDSREALEAAQTAIGAEDTAAAVASLARSHEALVNVYSQSMALRGNPRHAGIDVENDATVIQAFESVTPPTMALVQTGLRKVDYDIRILKDANVQLASHISQGRSLAAEALRRAEQAREFGDPGAIANADVDGVVGGGNNPLNIPEHVHGPDTHTHDD